ncbi:MAG: hypothetical protein AAB066_03225 [Candidatus Margulisiibacteriota bacterium]
MKIERSTGSVLVMAVFLIGMVTILVSAHALVINTDLQIVKNVIYTNEARNVAEAGIEDAISELRNNYLWQAGFSDKAFPINATSTYTVTVLNNYPSITLDSVGNVLGQYQCHIRVQLIVMGAPLAAPYAIRVDRWEIL